TRSSTPASLTSSSSRRRSSSSAGSAGEEAATTSSSAPGSRVSASMTRSAPPEAGRATVISRVRSSRRWLHGSVAAPPSTLKWSVSTPNGTTATWCRGRPIRASSKRRSAEPATTASARPAMAASIRARSGRSGRPERCSATLSEGEVCTIGGAAPRSAPRPARSAARPQGQPEAGTPGAAHRRQRGQAAGPAEGVHHVGGVLLGGGGQRRGGRAGVLGLLLGVQRPLGPGGQDVGVHAPAHPGAARGVLGALARVHGDPVAELGELSGERRDVDAVTAGGFAPVCGEGGGVLGDQGDLHVGLLVAGRDRKRRVGAGHRAGGAGRSEAGRGLRRDAGGHRENASARGADAGAAEGGHGWGHED